MINESYILWQIENRLSDIKNIPYPSEEDKVKEHLYKEFLDLIKEQPRADRWIRNTTPVVDGRYLVIQRYSIDGYEEVNTALWRDGGWVLEHGDFNWKYHQHDMERTIIAWQPCPSKVEDFVM